MRYLKEILLGIILGLLLSTFVEAQASMPFLGYFNTDPVEEMVDNWVKVPDQLVEVPIYDAQGEPTGETEWVWTYKLENQPYPVTKICDETPLNWLELGEYDGKGIVAVLIHQPHEQAIADALVLHADYLGHPQDIIDSAQGGDVTSQAIADQILYVQWEDETNSIVRKTVAEWKAAGEPDLMSDAQLYNEWYVLSNVKEEEQPLGEILGPNLLSNKNFERFTGTADDSKSDIFNSWEETNVDDPAKDRVLAKTKAFDGEYSVKVKRTINATVGIRQEAEGDVAEGEQYKCAVWCHGDGVIKPRIRIQTYNGSWSNLDFGTGNQKWAWKKYVRRVTIPAGATKLRIWFVANDVGSVFFDKPIIRKIQ